MVRPTGAPSLSAPVLEVAPALLGSVLRHTTEAGTVAVRLTEVEAYDGEADPGSHAYRGRTARNAVMFGPAGHLYTYLSYGIHVCANLVTGPEGRAAAVLLRAGEVIAGQDLARERRGRQFPERDLARGPGRLCQALGVTLAEGGGRVALATGERRPAGPIVAAPAPRLSLTFPGTPPGVVRTGPRVGLRQAADRPWRFWLDAEPTVSSYRPATRRGRPDHQ